MPGRAEQQPQVVQAFRSGSATAVPADRPASPHPLSGAGHEDLGAGPTGTPSPVTRSSHQEAPIRR